MKSVWLCVASKERQICWFLTVFFVLQVGAAHATVFVWTNHASGNWSNPTNWSPNEVPGSSDTAIITNSGAYTVTLDTSPTVASLKLGGGGHQTLATAGYTLTLNSNSVVNANGTLALNGGAVGGGGLLTINGVLNWTGGLINENCTITVGTNGTLVLAGVNGSGYVNYGVITNAGTVQLVSGNLQLENYYGGINGGLFNQASGVVELTADVSITAAYNNPVFVNQGTLVKSGGINTSTIYPSFINSGTVEANTGTISINGLGASFSAGSTFLGTGQTVLSGNTVTLNGSLTSSNLVLAGANLSGSAVLSGVLTWTSGQINNDCTLTVIPGAVLTLAGVNGTAYVNFGVITNAGTVQLVSGNLQLENYYGGIAGWLFNQPSGVVNLAADVSITAAYNTPEIVNQGTVLKSGGTHTSAIQAYLNNSGTVEANIGTIDFNDLGATLNVGSLFLGAGQILLTSGTVTFNGSLSSSNLVMAGAVYSGNGLLNGVLTWTSGHINQGSALTVNSDGVLIFAGTSGTTYLNDGVITNLGMVQLTSGNLELENYYGGIAGWLFNQPAGVVELTSDVSITAVYNTPEIVNQGTLVKVGGTNTSTIQPALSNVGGAVGAISGTLSLGGNNFTQNGGTVFVNLGGTDPGQSGTLAGVGSAGLGGLLTVTLANGYLPSLGSKFHILTSSSLSGTLSPLNIPSGLSVSYSNSGVYLMVTGVVALAPAITVQPTNVTVPYAGNAVFSVAATGLTPLNYQWLDNGVPLSDGGVVSGSATPTLALNGVTDNNEGNYSVIVTNASGSVTSSVATLTVLNCTAPSAGLVSWWPGNGNALDIVGGNNGVLTNGATFVTGEVGQGFEFLNNHAGVVVGNPTNLQLQTFTIETWIQRSSSTIATTDPTDGNGSGGIFAYGHGGYSLGIFPNGTLFLSQVDVSYVSSAAAVTDTNFHHVAVTATSNGTVFFYVDGVGYPATGSYSPGYSFTTPAAIGVRADNLNGNNNGSFYGVINQLSIYSAVLSSNQIAAIYGAGAAGKCLTEAPAITGQPQSQSVVLGGTATFTVVTTGDLPITNQWEFNGANLVNNGRITGSQGNVLVITNVGFGDAGTYLVSVSNVVGGTVSQPATLVVLPKTPVVTWSNAAPITYGAALNDVQLNATSSVPGTFIYNPPAGTIPGAGSYLLSVVFTPTDAVDYYSVTKYASLVVSNAPLTVTANSASRAYGQANPAFNGTITGLQGLDNIAANFSSAAVPASAPGGYPIVPSLLDPFGRLANYSVTLNNGTLTVSAAAPPSIASVLPATGSTNGGQTVVLTGTNFETGASVSFGSAPATAISVVSPTSLSLTIPAAAVGTVSVTIHNPDGNQASLPGAFTFGGPPVIQVQPLSESVVVGSNAQFQVTATGNGTLSYQWQFNGANLLNLGGISGVQTPMLTVSNLVNADAGSYQVLISNPYGTLVSTTAVLTVLSPPTVSAPQKIAVGVGATADFYVTAGGTPPFGYQWYQGVSPLAGATNPVLNFSSVQSSNAGQYTIVVTNIVGSVTSSQAMLTVLGYCASAQAAQSIYPARTTIPITVQTYNCGTQAAVAGSAATLWIYNSGTVRTIPLTTDTNGSKTVNFTPLMGEVGLVQYAAALPGVNNPAAQGSFTLVGMSLSPASASPVLTVGMAQTNTITLSNLTSFALEGITATSIGAPANVSVQVSVPETLPGNGTVQATYVLEASGTTPSQAQINLQFVTANGVTNNFPINATVVQLEPQLVTIPSTLHGTMVPGSQTLVSFGLANVGGTTSGSLQVILPANAPWLSVVTAQPLASLIPGQTNQITLALTPTNGLLDHCRAEFPDRRSVHVQLRVHPGR
jgi:hypothetical protein